MSDTPPPPSEEPDPLRKECLRVGEELSRLRQEVQRGELQDVDKAYSGVVLLVRKLMERSTEGDCERLQKLVEECVGEWQSVKRLAPASRAAPSPLPAPKQAGAEAGGGGMAASLFKMMSADDPTLDDVVGLDWIKEAIMMTINLPPQAPHWFPSSGLLQPKRTWLFFGPPGTGKTLLARAVARHFGFPIALITPAAVVDSYVGNTEKMVRAVFEEAKRRAPALVFFDEIDGLIPQGDTEHSKRMRAQILGELQTVLDECKHHQVFIAAATNYLDRLDEALQRRFLEKWFVGNPSPEARRVFIENLLEQPDLTHEVTPEQVTQLVQELDNWSAHDVRLMLTNALWVRVDEACKSVRYTANRTRWTAASQECPSCWCSAKEEACPECGSIQISMDELGGPANVDLRPLSFYHLKLAFQATPRLV